MDDRAFGAVLGGGVRPLVALTALAVVALAACTSTGGSSPSADASGSPVAAASLEGTPWQLTDYVGPGGGMLPVPDAVAATALFEGGRVSGSTGCNTYTGAYTLEGDALTVSGVATTMMACEPIPAAVEQAFTTALSSVATYRIAGDVLELTTAQGTVGLRFAVAQAPSLTGTRWVATQINNGTGGVTSVVAGTTVTAVFGEDGKMAGTSGCNDYSGSYTVDGSSMTLTGLTSTRKACMDDAVTAQEAQYLAALERVTSFTIAGDILQLRAEDGALQVGYQATLPE
jgi:heat shock protein HslJ